MPTPVGDGSSLRGVEARRADLPASVRFVEKPRRPPDVLVAVQDAVALH